MTQNNLGNRASDARASGRAARRGWRRRSRPIAPRWRNGPASACRSTGRRRRTTSATRLRRSGERESGTARLEEAVAAYRAALEEWTRERVPLDWATTQNNLGNALWSAWASARAGRRGWRRRSRPIAPRWRNGPASACRSTGRRRRTTSATRSQTLGRAGERDGAAGGGGRGLSRRAGGTDPRARAARLGDDPEQPRQRAPGARASARAGRRGWRRRSRPIARRWRNGPASACRSTGR